jgi:hypothetical protein
MIFASLKKTVADPREILSHLAYLLSTKIKLSINPAAGQTIWPKNVAEIFYRSLASCVAGELLDVHHPQIHIPSLELSDVREIPSARMRRQGTRRAALTSNCCQRTYNPLSAPMIHRCNTPTTTTAASNIAGPDRHRIQHDLAIGNTCVGSSWIRSYCQWTVP